MTVVAKILTFLKNWLDLGFYTECQCPNVQYDHTHNGVSVYKCTDCKAETPEYEDTGHGG